MNSTTFQHYIDLVQEAANREIAQAVAAHRGDAEGYEGWLSSTSNPANRGIDAKGFLAWLQSNPAVLANFLASDPAWQQMNAAVNLMAQHSRARVAPPERVPGSGRIIATVREPSAEQIQDSHRRRTTQLSERPDGRARFR